MDESASNARRTLFQGRFLRMEAIGTWEFVQRVRGSPVGILAVTPAGKLLLILQFRVPVGRVVVEIPAGLVGDSVNESWEAAAARELREETGWTAEHFERLTEGPTSAGLTSECMILVRATGLVKAGAPEPDGDETITVHEVPVGEVEAWLRAREAEGMLIDPKVWAGLYFLRAREGRMMAGDGSKVRHAAILAGGRSSRMGVDKALLEVGGMSMLERVARAAAEVCGGELMVVGKAVPAGWPGDLRVVFLADETADFAGPVAGLIRALEYVRATAPERTGGVLLLACDMPLISAGTLAALLAAHEAGGEGARATMAVSQEADGTVHAEPTCSVYEAALLPELREMVRTNRRSLQGLLGRPGVRSYLIPAQCARELLNVNDAASLAEARRVVEERDRINIRKVGRQ